MLKAVFGVTTLVVGLVFVAEDIIVQVVGAIGRIRRSLRRIRR